MAAVFAAAGKAAEMFVTSASSSAAAVNREVNRLGDAGLTNIDWDRAEDEILRPLKWPLSLLVRTLKHRHPDNLFTLRLAVTAMQLQALAIALQTLCLLGGAVAFAYRGSPAW